MMKRFWHTLVVGHNWKLMSLCIQPSGTLVGGPVLLSTGTHHIYTEDMRRLLYGFTTTFEECNCGARRETRILGYHKLTGDGVDHELEQLQKLL